MKYILPIVLLALVSHSRGQAQNYILQKSVIGSGGGEMSSVNYSVNGTVGQPMIGSSSSAGYLLESGFWTGPGGGTGAGCEYAVGDANNSGGYNGLDVSYGVNFFKGGAPPPYVCECTPGNSWYVAGDVNSSCSYNGLDITFGVNYFKGGAGPTPCADCPPGGIVIFTSEISPSPANTAGANVGKQGASSGRNITTKSGSGKAVDSIKQK